MKRSDYIKTLNERFAKVPPQEMLRYFLEVFGDKVAVASSFGLEDQVLTDMVVSIRRDARVFTLDTGRLFPETYSLIDRTNQRYGIRIEVFFPDLKKVEKMTTASGINLFYESVEKRKECCRVRKIEPLKRAFKGLDAWICGLRREQSVTRENIDLIEWDEANGLIKLNPLVNWSEEEVWKYIREQSVPYNKLHDTGFPSIGCQPCTRAVKEGEDIRAGRWWWEAPEHKECGLHKR